MTWKDEVLTAESYLTCPGWPLQMQLLPFGVVVGQDRPFGSSHEFLVLSGFGVGLGGGGGAAVWAIRPVWLR